MKDPQRIVQIIPGGGWTATYKSKDDTEFSSPVLAWALTADGDVYAIDAGSHGVVDRVDSQENFLRLVEPPNA